MSNKESSTTRSGPNAAGDNKETGSYTGPQGGHEPPPYKPRSQRPTTSQGPREELPAAQGQLDELEINMTKQAAEKNGTAEHLQANSNTETVVEESSVTIEDIKPVEESSVTIEDIEPDQGTLSDDGPRSTLANSPHSPSDDDYWSASERQLQDPRPREKDISLNPSQRGPIQVNLHNTKPRTHPRPTWHGNERDTPTPTDRKTLQARAEGAGGSWTEPTNGRRPSASIPPTPRPPPSTSSSSGFDIQDIPPGNEESSDDEPAQAPANMPQVTLHIVLSDARATARIRTGPPSPPPPGPERDEEVEEMETVDAEDERAAPESSEPAPQLQNELIWTEPPTPDDSHIPIVVHEDPKPTGAVRLERGLADTDGVERVCVYCRNPWDDGWGMEDRARDEPVHGLSCQGCGNYICFECANASFHPPVSATPEIARIIQDRHLQVQYQCPSCEAKRTQAAVTEYRGQSQTTARSLLHQLHNARLSPPGGAVQETMLSQIIHDESNETARYEDLRVVADPQYAQPATDQEEIRAFTEAKERAKNLWAAIAGSRRRERLLQAHHAQVTELQVSMRSEDHRINAEIEAIAREAEQRQAQHEKPLHLQRRQGDAPGSNLGPPSQTRHSLQTRGPWSDPGPPSQTDHSRQTPQEELEREARMDERRRRPLYHSQDTETPSTPTNYIVHSPAGANQEDRQNTPSPSNSVWPPLFSDLGNHHHNQSHVQPSPNEIRRTVVPYRKLNYQLNVGSAPGDPSEQPGPSWRRPSSPLNDRKSRAKQSYQSSMLRRRHYQQERGLRQRFEELHHHQENNEPRTPNREQSKRASVCAYCGATDHSSFHCGRTNQAQRVEILRREGRCLNCLGSSHWKAEDCYTQGRCIVCRGKHHSTIHRAIQAEEEEAQNHDDVYGEHQASIERDTQPPPYREYPRYPTIVDVDADNHRASAGRDLQPPPYQEYPRYPTLVDMNTATPPPYHHARRHHDVPADAGEEGRLPPPAQPHLNTALTLFTGLSRAQRADDEETIHYTGIACYRSTEIRNPPPI